MRNSLDKFEIQKWLAPEKLQAQIAVIGDILKFLVKYLFSGFKRHETVGFVVFIAICAGQITEFSHT